MAPASAGGFRPRGSPAKAGATSVRAPRLTPRPQSATITDFPLIDQSSSPISQFVQIGESLFFAVADRRAFRAQALYVTDGTTSGTRQLLRGESSPSEFTVDDSISNLARVDGSLFFTGLAVVDVDVSGSTVP